MSVIYIGPYRQNDYIGIESSLYLRSIHQSLINKNISFYSRPYYTRQESVGDPMNNYYSGTENLPDSFIPPSTVIQHAHIEHMCIGLPGTNIAIPILSNRIAKTSRFSIVQHLNNFDHIIVGDDEEKSILIKSDIKKPVHIADSCLLDHVTDTDIINSCYDYGSLNNQQYKFMFIGEYQTNIDIINNILFAFISSFRANNNCSLNLILKGTVKNKQDLNEFSNRILRQLKVAHRLNLNVYFNELSIKDIFAALNSADCLISLNNDYNQKLYSNYIISQNKLCISYKNTNYHISPTSILSYEYNIGDYIRSVDINSLISGMSRALSDKTSKIEKHKKHNKNIGKIVCDIMS